MPLGAVGEIYIGGAGVARGYLNRAEMTAERFVPDGFSAVAGAQMYKTGDLGCYLGNGDIEFLGRNDHQVKIRGYRIELGEIEARLLEHGLVKEAVVVAREEGEEAGEKRLVAYVVVAEGKVESGEKGDSLQEGAEVEAEKLGAMLRTHLAGRLPEYMVPSAYVRLERMPLTPNGKVDRKALPAPESGAYAQRSYEPPQGETEEVLASLWQEVLGVERVGRHDHFFELGGHSLLAMRLQSRIWKVFGVELPMGTLFTAPALTQLAQALTRASMATKQDSIPSITPVSREGALPLSFAQQRLWFLAQLEAESAIYNIPVALRLRGDLDSSALRRSLDALFARHEGLRSIFVAVDGQPHVELLPAEKGLSLVEEDLRGIDDRWERVTQLSRDEAWGPFDLSRGPLMRARLIQLEERDYVFLLTQHHIVSDEWSMGIFVREIGELYRAFRRGRPNRLAPLSIQYPDYAAWQRQWLSGERLQKQSDYWRQTLSDAPVLLDLPTDRPRPPRQSFAASYVPIHIDRELTRGVKELSSRYDATLFMTLLAAWAAVLSRLSGQEDLVIGVPAANRGRPETEGLIGFFINTLALPVKLRNEPSVAELLGQVRATALAAQDHQDLPFEQVVEIVQPPRRLNHTPLFQVMLLWQNNEALPELPSVAVEPAGIADEAVKFDLEMGLYEQGDTIVGRLKYATALFDEATIQRQRGYLLTMLKAMAANSEQRLADIELLASEERMSCWTAWNATESTYPEHLCIHQVFEQQVERNPQATAVVFEEQSLTYAELNAEVNRVAHHLIALGVKPDDRVAICVERGAGMVIGLLGILKAAGAYVPLDPAYPSQRLREIVADAGPKLLLSDAAGRAALGEAVLAEKMVVDLNQTPPAWTGRPNTNPDAKALGLTSQHPAYVIYTSGSTGKPKGVIITHDCVVNFLVSMSAAPGITAQDRLLAVTSISFDIAGLELYLPLSSGSQDCDRQPRRQRRSQGTAISSDAAQDQRDASYASNVARPPGGRLEESSGAENFVRWGGAG